MARVLLAGPRTQQLKLGIVEDRANVTREANFSNMVFPVHDEQDRKIA